jgi:hypothetical protein
MSKLQSLIDSLQSACVKFGKGWKFSIEEATDRVYTLREELSRAEDNLQVHNDLESQIKELDLLSYLQFQKQQEAKIENGGANTCADSTEKQHRCIQDALEAACKDKSIWKVQFYLNDDYFRLAPKRTASSECWSPVSEAKLKALSLYYAIQTYSNPNDENVFFVDQTNTIPSAWYTTTTKTAMRQLEMYWEENMVYFNQGYVEKMEKFITASELPPVDIYSSITLFDSEQYFFNLVRIRGIFTKQQILDALS